MMSTPVIEISIAGRPVLCKLEGENPSGSHKDRAARFLVERLHQCGRLRPGSRRRLLVSSSGNFARAVAHHTSADEAEIIVIIDVLSPTRLIESLGRYPHARVIVIDEPDATGSHLQARLRLVRELLTSDPEIEFLDQYSNRLIPAAYARSLAPELARQVDLDGAALFAPVGTGAMLNGLISYRRAMSGAWPAFAVDANGSGLFRPPIHGARRLLSGYGNGRPTGLLAEVRAEIEYAAYVTDAEAVNACWRLRRREGLTVGPSSGAVLAAIENVVTRRPDLLPERCLPIAILPDWGDAYADTVFDADWLRKNGLQPACIREAVPLGAALAPPVEHYLAV
jgi:cysteine synthase